MSMVMDQVVVESSWNCAVLMRQNSNSFAVEEVVVVELVIYQSATFVVVAALEIRLTVDALDQRD